MQINFVSNLPLHRISGGWSGINFRIHQELLKYYDINYVGPVNPKSAFIEKGISKIRRLAGLQGSFHFFSETRLTEIKKQVEKSCNNEHYSFYFGQTPWIKCGNNGTYGTYIDASFPTYMDVFSDRNRFLKKDLLRIQKLEERWLQGAKHIFMGSQWAWDEMLKHYDLDEKQKTNVWVGGNIDIPKKDDYSGGKNLLFISLDFENKGGFVVVEVLKRLRLGDNQITLTIIGQKPPDNVLSIEGIHYAGLLRKNVKEEYDLLVKFLSKAFLLVHPTKMDTMGAVIIESGYFGCPAIASRAFGIPELIIENQTGFLVDDPQDVNKIVSIVLNQFNHHSGYLELRRKTREFCAKERSYSMVGTKIYNSIADENTDS